MACKRKLEEFDVSEVKECKNAVVHGVVTELSPLKRSRKSGDVRYFYGQMGDGKGDARLICFEPSLRDKMLPCFESKDSVRLVDCQVRAAQGGGSEILMTRSTKVQASPKKFYASSAAVNVKEAAKVSLNKVGALVIGDCECEGKEGGPSGGCEELGREDFEEAGHCCW